MIAYLIMRAGVGPVARGAFYARYETGHLPDAVAENAHIAFCEFPDLPAVLRMTASDTLKGMIAAFNRHRDGKVNRTRDPVELIQI